MQHLCEEDSPGLWQAKSIYWRENFMAGFRKGYNDERPKVIDKRWSTDSASGASSHTFGPAGVAITSRRSFRTFWPFKDTLR